MKQRLNFAPEPFRTKSPRLLGLWVLNIVLLVLLVGSLWHWSGLRDANRHAHGEIDVLRDRQRELGQQHSEVLQELQDVDMKVYTKQVRQFHEVQIAFQTHWGKLLDSLGDLLPEDVRIRSLHPGGRASQDRGKTREVTLQLEAEARNKEAQLAFIRTLQEHEAFDDIRFESENYETQGIALAFEISFTFKPGGSP